MDWQRVIEQALPRRRTDEPTGLRRDIVDEVLDHLHCAAEHEQRRGAAPDQAWRRAVDALGDPVKLARKLWFQAMKENIMRDRLLLGGVGLTVLMMAALCVLGFKAFGDMRRVNAEMLDRMAALEDGASDLGWGTVTFEVHQADAAGRPDPDVEFRIRGFAFSDQREAELTRKTGPDGKVTIGPIRPGQYTFDVHRGSWSLADLEESTPLSFDLYPDQELTLRLTSPLARMSAHLDIDVDVPDGHFYELELRAQGWPEASLGFEGRDWSLGGRTLRLTVDSDGRYFREFGSSSYGYAFADRTSELLLGALMSAETIEVYPDTWELRQVSVWRDIPSPGYEPPVEYTEQGGVRFPGRWRQCSPIVFEDDAPRIEAPAGETVKWSIPSLQERLSDACSVALGH